MLNINQATNDEHELDIYNKKSFSDHYQACSFQPESCILPPQKLYPLNQTTTLFDMPFNHLPSNSVLHNKLFIKEIFLGACD
mmetsp:Transcript_3348/g.5057  ORF Transcript_3348/g.5057 Transcript_3348/m.5057 type:complete len:82 (-) Transcript_3348:745-990(-)